MASLRRAKKEAKKRGEIFIDPTKEKKALLRKTNIKVKETNKRLRRLDNKGYYGTFSSRKLFDRLGGKVNALERDVSGKVIAVKLNNKMSITQITAINKATNQFLNSLTSSPKKLESVIEKTKDSMFKTLKTKDDDLTMDDIEFYYNMLGNDDFDYFAEKIGASILWALIDDAIEYNDNQDRFLMRLAPYVDINDIDVRKHAVRLFNKYVGG